MLSNIYWVAQSDGSWISNRIRNDKIDIAFTIYPQTSEKNCKVIIREAWISDAKSRATRKTGAMYFSDHKQAKLTIRSIIEQANNTAVDVASAKQIIYENMMRCSLTCSHTDGSGLMPRNVFSYETPTVIHTVPTEVSSMTETISSIVEKFEEVIDLSTYKPGDQAPAGYIWIGKELTKIGWPS